jgi:hypothetical protein
MIRERCEHRVVVWLVLGFVDVLADSGDQQTRFFGAVFGFEIALKVSE